MAVIPSNGAGRPNPTVKVRCSSRIFSLESNIFPAVCFPEGFTPRKFLAHTALTAVWISDRLGRFQSYATPQEVCAIHAEAWAFLILSPYRMPEPFAMQAQASSGKNFQVNQSTRSSCNQPPATPKGSAGGPQREDLLEIHKGTDQSSLCYSVMESLLATSVHFDDQLDNWSRSFAVIG